MKIKPQHGLAIGYCEEGQFAFAKKQGWNWRDICRNGIDEELLIATGDEMALNIVEFANGHGQSESEAG